MQVTGQTEAHGASVQCMQAIDTDRSPGFPSLMVTTRRRLMPHGTSFSFLQAVTQALHSMQRSRSEEHTSELQSRGHLVCRLLLEKKNKPQTPTHPTRHQPHPSIRASSLPSTPPARPDIYTLPLHDALPICACRPSIPTARRVFRH